MNAADALTPEEICRLHRELALKDKSYRALLMGQEVGHYLRAKRKSLTPASYRDYEGVLHKFALFFGDLDLKSLEPPVGTERLEEFLDHQWGDRAGRTYNKALSILRDFFKWAVLRQRLHGDPTLPIKPARKSTPYRTTFTSDQRLAIFAANPEVRDRLALHLLLDYGLRKGALQKIQFRHFDHMMRRLTVFTKGQKIRTMPIPSPPFWLELERLIIEAEALPEHYLLPRQKAIPRRFDASTGKASESVMHRFPDQPMGDHGLHNWWYGCLQRAGIVAEGVRSGERMHKARHTAGQRVLDKTGNLKATQKLLGHETITTTADIYTDWDVDQLAETMSEVLDGEEWLA